MDLMNETVLQMNGIVKGFPGVKVFDGFDLEIRRGEIHCLCGENGAGKSTLIKIMSGAHTQDAGELILDGDVVKLDPFSAMAKGIQTIYQEHVLCPDMLVFENLFIGRELTKGGILDKSGMVKRTQELLDEIGAASIRPTDRVIELSSGEQKFVEIIKGLLMDAKIIIMDEPTASFSAAEVDTLLAMVKRLRDQEISIVYISHHLDEVFRIADRVTVIRDGNKIKTYEIADLTEEQLTHDMVGRDVSSFYKRDKSEIGDVVLKVENLKGVGVIDASFELRRGECLGIAGMVGSGRSEIANILFGCAKKEGGKIIINGKEVNITSPLEAIENKLCYITESRQDTGLFLNQTIAQNVTVVDNNVNEKSPVLNLSTIGKTGTEYIKKLKIKTPSETQKAVNLSGGNQQKVVLAKWFAAQHGEVFIFDEPTRGIDVGSKEEIYALMTSLLKEGKSILMISSDMPELIAMSDRIMVMRFSRMVGELSSKEISEENILKLSIGGN